MASYLCITVRFLQPLSHGRKDGGAPEWPPSPLRMFQALVNAAAGRWNERIRLQYAVPALAWLAKQGEPTIIAATGTPSSIAYRLYVPDNVGDSVAKSWCAGNVAASIADYRIAKDVRPVHLNGETVHYLYRIATGYAEHRETLYAAARSITHLGWGIDMVIASVGERTDAEIVNLSGERWRPTEGDGSVDLRVSNERTLEALMTKHEAFLGRITSEGFKPVPPLPANAYRTVAYRRATDPEPRPWVALSILDPDASGNRSFATVRRCRDVAAWVRHAAGRVCIDWPDVASFVHGHDPTDESQPPSSGGIRARFMYLPLPTINHALNRVESIRRVLITAPPGFRHRTDWIRRRLVGEELVEEDTGAVVGLLNLLPTSDWVLRQYTGSSSVWSTVTPVVMPGYDDRCHVKADRLLRKTFVHAGLPPEIVALAELEWRGSGYRPGVDLASRYRRPDSLKGYPTHHVRVRFPHALRGPLAIGSGRYRGLGLFAAEGQ